MHNIIRLVSLVFILVIVGCANINSIHRSSVFSDDRSEAVFIDAKQRGLISNPDKAEIKITEYRKNGDVVVETTINNQLRLCIEAAPDVFSAFATSAAAQVAVKAAEKSGEGRFSLASSENAATISRTQTINMLREAMFRTCERYLNGAIDKNELIVQAARDQRVMVSILAIEQLTGVYMPATTALLTQSTASLGGPTAETLKLVADAKEAADTATEDAKKAEEDAKKAEEDAKTNGLNDKKDCQEVLADEKLTEVQKAKCKLAKEKRDNTSALAVKAKTQSDHYSTIKKLADVLGGGASSASGTAQFNAAQSQAILSQNIENVAKAVVRIVENTFQFDEVRMTCVVMLRQKRNDSDGLYNKCLELLDKFADNELDALNKETTWTYKCDDSCDKLKAYWMPGGTVNAANKERLEQLMSKNGLVTGPGRIMNLIYSAEFARFRKLFVDELKL